MPNICQEFRSSLVYVGGWIRNRDCNGNGVADTQDIATGTSSDLNHDGRPDECEGIGDLNCDGVKNFDDIDAFVLALSDPPSYQSTYPDCALAYADCNGDGAVNFDDINAFVAVLSGN